MAENEVNNNEKIKSAVSEKPDLRNYFIVSFIIMLFWCYLDLVYRSSSLFKSIKPGLFVVNIIFGFTSFFILSIPFILLVI